MTDDDESNLRADPRIVEVWVKGWTLSRSKPAPSRLSGAFRVEVGEPLQKARYVFSQWSDDVQRLAASINEPWIFLKICAAPQLVGNRLPLPWSLQKPGYMMMSKLTRREPVRQLPEGFALNVITGHPVSTVQVIEPNGDIAASGHGLLVDGFAIYDRIVTNRDYQRRGFGTAVMTTLDSIALDHEIDQGILVATGEGRELYQSLGWRLYTPYTTAVIRANEVLMPYSYGNSGCGGKS